MYQFFHFYHSWYIYKLNFAHNERDWCDEKRLGLFLLVATIGKLGWTVNHDQNGEDVQTQHRHRPECRHILTKKANRTEHKWTISVESVWFFYFTFYSFTISMFHWSTNCGKSRNNIFSGSICMDNANPKRKESKAHNLCVQTINAPTETILVIEWNKTKKMFWKLSV